MIMDNKSPPTFQKEIRDKIIYFQTSSPVIYYHNVDERAIIMLKYHFISGLFSTDPNFPMQNWDQLLDQADITLNLLCPSRLNPKISSYTKMNGIFEYNRTTMAPPGTIMLVHEKPHNRGTWAPHIQEVWYV